MSSPSRLTRADPLRRRLFAGGVLLLVAGLVLLLAGLASFVTGFAAEDFDRVPAWLWLALVGLPVMGVGAVLLQLGVTGEAAGLRLPEGGLAGSGEAARLPVTSAALQVEQVPFTDPEVQRLVRDIQDEYQRIYGGGDATPIRNGEFEPPAGAFFVARLYDRPVGMGGWRFRPDVSGAGGDLPAEVKRMYVVPDVRRTGVARAILARLEESARRAGADVMILETGEPQPGAVALYRSAGYTTTVRFGHYAGSPHSVYLARRL